MPTETLDADWHTDGTRGQDFDEISLNHAICGRDDHHRQPIAIYADRGYARHSRRAAHR